MVAEFEVSLTGSIFLYSKRKERTIQIILAQHILYVSGIDVGTTAISGIGVLREGRKSDAITTKSLDYLALLDFAENKGLDIAVYDAIGIEMVEDVSSMLHKQERKTTTERNN